jgi:transposase
MDRKPYPSDLTNNDWALLEPLIPPAKTGGRKRTADGRRGCRGYDPGKHVNGRKRHVIVDTEGLALKAFVTEAHYQDGTIRLWGFHPSSNHAIASKVLHPSFDLFFR